MTIRDASFQLLESALNKYLSLDPEISRQFASLHGAVIGFDLAGTGLQLYFIPEQNGRLQVLSRIEGKPDCLVKGSPISLLRSSGNNNAEQVFSGDIEIQGNSALAQQFTGILMQIDVDWEEQLSHITGDVVAHQVGSAFRQSQGWLNRVSRSTGLNLQEYLQEEARLLPGIYELENFYSDVDQLRDQAERLEARLTRIKNSRDKSL